MSYLLAATLLVPRHVAPPPGIDREAFARALCHDTFEVLDDLAAVVATVSDSDDPVTALDVLAKTGATIGAVVAGDAPDLPGLLVGKLFSACEDREAGVLPAEGGGLVGLASRLPVPDWLRASGISLDTPDPLAVLHAAAPARAVSVGPGWHRLRRPEDITRLDPRLEGWHATRALLSGQPPSG